MKNKSARVDNMQELQDRLVFRLLNEAMACWRENIVETEEQIDAGVIFGTGFAPFRGGPINYIRTEGSDALRKKLNQLEASHGERFKRDQAWDKLSS